MSEKKEKIKTAVTEKKKEIKSSVTEKKKEIKKSVNAKLKRGKENNVAPIKLKLLITVVNRNKAEYYLDLIQSHDVNMQAVALANGTADQNTLRLLGLTDTEKAVIFSVIKSDKLPDALIQLEEKFKTVKGGNGIAFTVPFTSVIGTLIYGFLSDNRTVVKEERK